MSSQLVAQALVVGVRASYIGGGSNATLQIGDPVNLSVDGLGSLEGGKQIEFQLDTPMMMSVSATDVESYSIAFSPPSGFSMLIDGIRRTVIYGSGTGFDDVKITLVRASSSSRESSPVGEASSIQWLSPTFAVGPRWPYINFELGSGKNGERLPPLKLPVKNRTTATNDFVPPDSAEITNYIAANGGFQFSVPACDVKLEVDPQNPGLFSLKFYEPGATTEFARYSFNAVLWPSDSNGVSKRVEITKWVSGGVEFQSAISGYFGESGTSANSGVNTWHIEDWHQVSSNPGRVIYVTRNRTSSQVGLVPYVWQVTSWLTDTMEVRSGVSPAPIVATTTREFTRYTMPETDSADVVIPKQTVEGVGDGDYVTQYYGHPDQDHIRGSQAPGGRRRFEEEGWVSGTSQQKLVVHESWLDASPDFNPSSGVIPGGAQTTTLFEHAASLAAFQLPQSIERSVGGTIVAKSTFNHTELSGPGNHGMISTERRDYYSTTGYVVTWTKAFRPDVSDISLRGKLFSVTQASGAKQSFAYASGSYSGNGWMADFKVITLSGASTGGSSVSEVDGLSVDELRLHANQSTKTVEYFHRGRLVRREVWVFLSATGVSPSFNTGGPVAWETFGYTADGRVASRTASTGASYTAYWAGTQKTWQKDETQLVTDFGYDNLDRVKSIERRAANGVPAQRTELEYDAAHRIRFARVGPLNGEQLVTETEYDGAGRVKRVRRPGQGTTVSAGSITTHYTYPNGGRDEAVTFNHGTAQAATRIVERHADGRTKNVTGSAVVNEHYTYNLGTDGRLTVTRKLGPSQKRPSAVTYDLLGRLEEEKIDGFGSSGSTKSLVTHRVYYPISGLLHRTYTVEGVSGYQVSGSRVFEYDEFGALKAAGMDLNGNHFLDANSTDRFETFTTSFALDNGAWWRRVVGRRYHTDNSTATYQTRSDTRLTELTGMIAQTINVDAWGNATTTTVSVDTSIQAHRVRTKMPDSTTQERVLVGGLSVQERWFGDNDEALTGAPVLSSSFTFDALGRVRQAIDARRGTETTVYWYGTTLPREQYDARNVLVGTYTYDGGGRLASRSDAVGSASFTYTLRGELEWESGSGTQPSQRTYSDFGELKELRTYRNGTAASADLSSWYYDDNTGWLVSKADAAAAMVSYDYVFTATHREVIRHSARNPSAPTTTRYALATGDLLEIDYTDGTNDVDFLVYHRDGLPKQVQDITGTRTLAYQNGQLVSEALPAWFSGLVLSHDYHTVTSTTSNTVAGRYHRLKLGIAGDSDREMSLVYGYDDLGRTLSVTADYKAQGSRAALNVPTTYGYKLNSSLWETLTQGSFGATRAFENNRDVLQSITAIHSAAGTVATFGYGTDNAGRREWATQSGTAFGDFVDTAVDATYYRYGYSAAHELQSAIGYRGTNPATTTSPLPGRGFGYTYDTAGNRKTATVSGDSVSYLDSPGGSEGGNELNQTRSRGTLKTRVSGTSIKTASVTVGAVTASREVNPGRYWDAALPDRPQAGSVSVSANNSGNIQNGTVTVLTRPATETFTYDADGNLTEDGLWVYEWDAEDRLKRMYTHPSALTWNAPNRELLFTYDYLGRRVRKVSKLNGTTQSDHKFIYTGWSLVAELDSATNKIVRSYAWGLDLDSTVGGTGGVGGLVLQTIHSDTGLTAYHMCYDGSGNVTALVNRTTGAVAASYEYGPFGENVRSQTFDSTLASHGQPFRFSTKFTDSETGLTYYGYRYYDASLGRFINRDPIGEVGGNNLYGFVANDPVNRWDYLGLEDTPTYDGPQVIWMIPDPEYEEPGDTGADVEHSLGRLDRSYTSTTGDRHARNEWLTGAPDSEERSVWDILRGEWGYRIPTGGSVDTPFGRMTFPAPAVSPEVWQALAMAQLRDAITIAKFEAEVAISIAGPEIAVAWVVRGVRYVVMVRRMAQAEKLAAEIRAGSLARYGHGEGITAMADVPVGGYQIASRIKDSSALVRYADEAGRSVQKSIDALTDQLRAGNLNPGIGTKNLFKDIFYARARDGARVFYRQTSEGIEILAKANKANESQVIGTLHKIYGGP